MRPTILVTVLLAIGAPADASQAQAGPDPADRAAVTSCLRDSAASPQSCIGSVAVVCTTGQSGADRSAAQIGCSRREEAVWRERLETAARLAAASLDAGSRTRFAAVHRAWEGYVVQKCAFLGDLASPAQAGPTQAACDLREVALRAMEVERLARRARESAAAPRRPELQR